MKIASLFDYTGRWSQPYRDAGYNVTRIDIQTGNDILDLTPASDCHGIIIQPPCTDFANSGARWFAGKDATGQTAYSIRLVYAALEWVHASKPKWWVLENPAGRIHKLIPELGKPVFKFSPHQYGESYRKTTWLWGEFNPPPMTTPDAEIPDARPGQPDAWYSKVGGKSIATKNYRSATSILFAREFFKANP
jgi:hypothetical protein